MRAVAAEWVGVFLAVQQSGSGRAISEVLPIGPEKKKKRNICLLYDGANDGRWDGGRVLHSTYTLRTPTGEYTLN